MPTTSEGSGKGFWLGGGIAGMTAALEAAEAGCDVRDWSNGPPSWAAAWPGRTCIFPSSALPPAA